MNLKATADAITFTDVGSDESVLFALYSAVRADELGMESLDPALRSQILQFQFEAQRRGYREQFPAAERRLILRNGSPIGWLILDRSGSALHPVDIAIVAEEKGRGVGTGVIRSLQDEAGAEKRPVVLTVLRTNDRAMALYLRLGFRVIEETQTHRLMEWRADTPPNEERR
jgi:ribosomal protein S18 acetylase RimI-like enzyme